MKLYRRDWWRRWASHPKCRFGFACTSAKGTFFTRTYTSEILIFPKETVVVSVFWISVNSAVKVSVVHFYTTLFPNRAFQIITHTTIWLVILYWVATVVATFLICRPFAYNWDQTISGTCGDLHSFWLASSVIGLVFDIWVVVLPMPILWGLHMKLSRKIALVFIFGLGAL